MGRFPGGLVSATPKIPTLSDATGIWTLREALQAKAQGIWPKVNASLEFLEKRTSTDTSTSTTFAAIDFGADVPGRVIIAALIIADGGVNSNTINGFSIGNDASPTKQVEAHRDNATTDVVSAYIYTGTPTGTSGDIVITTSATMNAASFKALYVFRLTNSVETPTDTLTTTGTSSASGTIDCEAGGVVVAVTSYLDPGGPETAASASKSYVSAQTGLTIGATGAATPDISWTELLEDAEDDFSENVSGSARMAFVAAAFGPS